MFAIYGTTYGAGNGSTTFNLPDFRNRTVWGTDSFGYIEAGLPNITGQTGGWLGGSTVTTKGALSQVSSTVQHWGASVPSGTSGVKIDASLSNPIYGKSDTVQPPAIKVRVVTRYK